VSGTLSLEIGWQESSVSNGHKFWH